MGVVSWMRQAFRARDGTGARADGQAPGGRMTLSDPGDWEKGWPFETGETAAMKISAVNAAVEIRSDSFGKLPVFVMDGKTKGRVVGHYLDRLLADRPNEAMSPFVLKKTLEVHRLQFGNAYLLPVRNRSNAVPRELLPVHPDFVLPYVDTDGVLWYVITNPQTGERRKFRSYDVVHLKGYSADGITGVSVLSRASQTIRVASTQQSHEESFFRNKARPSGVLAVDTDLSAEARDVVRKEWNRIHEGADHAFRVAVLDRGMKYQQIGISQREAQFVESKDVLVADIARFYGVPLYKLQAGKQSYSSNEQNAIEYVVSAVHPTIRQAEEEFTYKLLFESEQRRGLEVRINLNAELRGDMAARGTWYKMMRETGAFSVNDIRALEDMDAVDGGETRYASLNYVPLDAFEEISRARNGSMDGGYGG